MFDFPNNPFDGQTVVHSNGRTYEYNQSLDSWMVVSSNLATLTTRVAALENTNFLILE